jgi:hypothetical protein
MSPSTRESKRRPIRSAEAADVGACGEANRTDGTTVFDPAGASTAVNELAREERERIEREQREATVKRALAERTYVELLLRAGENRPGDADRLRALINDLGITPAQMQADIASLVDAARRQQIIAERDELCAAHGRARDEFLAARKKWEDEEKPRLRREVSRAAARAAQVNESRTAMERMRARRPILFEPNGPARVLGAPLPPEAGPVPSAEQSERTLQPGSEHPCHSFSSPEPRRPNLAEARRLLGISSSAASE